MLRVGTAQLLVSHLSPELVCGRGRGEHGAPVGVPGLVKQPQLVAEPVQSNIIYISSILYCEAQARVRQGSARDGP